MQPQAHSTRGRHVILDIWFTEWDDSMLAGFVEGVLKACNAHVIQDMRRLFPKEGITYIAVLDESHISVHTYPEHNFLSVDIYTCGTKADPYKAIDYVREHWATDDIVVHHLTRGVR